MDMISLSALKSAVQTGGLRTIGVAAAGGLFFVTAQPRGGEWMVLATVRGKRPRAFSNPGRAILLLHGIGVKKIAVDISGWDPARAGEEARRRPDVTERLRWVHGVGE